jgi:hypothetical protein
MQGIPPEIEGYPVHHLPIIKAYADQLGLVGLINHYVPTEMDVDADTVVLGLVLDMLRGQSPLYHLEEFRLGGSLTMPPTAWYPPTPP